MFQLTKKVLQPVAVSDKSNKDLAKQEVNDMFNKKRIEVNRLISKQWFGYGIKLVLASGAIIFNKEAATEVLVSASEVKPNLPLPRNKGMVITGILKKISSFMELNSAVCLDDLTNENSKEYVKKCYDLCSKITGFSVQDILNMKHQYHIHNRPVMSAVTHNKDTGEVTEAVLGYKEYVDINDYIPTLQSRLIIALDKWVQGDAPNKYSLTINSFNEIKEYFNEVGEEVKPHMFKAISKAKEEMDSVLPLTDENNNVRM